MTAREALSRMPARMRRSLLWAVAVAVVVLAAGFLLVLVPLLRDAEIRRIGEDLVTRAEVRRSAVERWLGDATRDARVVSLYPGSRSVAVAGPDRGPAFRAHLEPILAGDARALEMDALFVLDGRQHVVAASRAGADPGAEARALARRVSIAGRESTEFVRMPDGTPRVAFVVPVPQGANGVVLALSDPRRWLYPFLATRPSTVPSIDAVLVRAEGDSQLVLSPIRAMPGAELRHREPTHEPAPRWGSAGSRDVFGRFRSRDGTRVLAFARPIAGTSWVLTLVVTERSALAAFHRRMVLLGAGSALFVVLLGALLAALYAWLDARHLAELARSRTRLALLLDQASVPILFAGPEGRVRECNAAAEAFYRHPPGGLVGRHLVTDLRAADEREAAREQLARVLAGESMRTEAIQLAADGTRLEVIVSASRVEDEDGPVVVSVVHDIRERRQADERLRKLSRAVESSLASIVITDIRGTIDYVNPRFLELTGYSLEEALGANPRILKSGATDPSVYESMWSTISAGHEWQGELLNRKKDGELYWERISISPLRDETGHITHYVGIKEDVTARRREQEQLRATQLQLLQSQKMETVGRLAGGVAHDFNNLLTIIHGYGELLQSTFPPGSDDRSKVDEILKAAGRAAQLTRQLLAFSRRQVLEPRVLDLRASVAEAERMLRRVISENIEFEARPAAELGHVRADPVQIEQVLLNLVVNARDAMPGGGRLSLSLADLELGESVEGVAEPVAPGRYVMLAVSDTGQGLSPEVREHLFEPFFTTKEVGKGTGLGLATVYGIVKQSGGFVGVESTPGAGTTFRVYLPRVDDPLPTASPAAPSERRLGHGEHVLLVEDDDAVRGLAWVLLDECGFRVTAVNRGVEALEVAGREGAALDLLLTDVVMPGMSGHELARRMRERHPALAVLLISGYSDEAVAHDAGHLPGVRFLQKPFTSQVLATAVHDALAERPPAP